MNDKKLANSIPPFPQNHRISPIFTDLFQVWNSAYEERIQILLDLRIHEQQNVAI